jgi:hypothetical protein
MPTDHEEEHRHQAVIDPVLKVLTDLQAAGANRQRGMPQVVVGIRERADGPHRATTVAPSSTSPPLASA